MEQVIIFEQMLMFNKNKNILIPFSIIDKYIRLAYYFYFLIWINYNVTKSRTQYHITIFLPRVCTTNVVTLAQFV